MHYKTKYKHLTTEEREKIFLFSGKGLSIRDIARRLNRQPSTISRELARNSKDYSPSRAQRRARRERKNSRLGKLKVLGSPFIYNYVLDKLEQGWSPEQIAGRIKLDLGINIVHETLYQFIYSYFGRKHKLHSLLRRHHRTRKKKNSLRKSQKGPIPNRIDISLRPKEVEARNTVGHWEGDTLVGKGRKGGITTLVERKSRYVQADLLFSKRARDTSQKIIESFKRLPNFLKKTITFDNGLEFAGHERITRETGIGCFFAEPYHAWQRGTCENTNGLIRWYLPKGTDFRKLDQTILKAIVDALNNRPRKILNFLTPKEVLERELKQAKCCTSG